MESKETLQSIRIYVSAYLPFQLSDGLCNVKINDQIIQLRIANPEQPFLNPDGLLSDDVGRLWRVNERYNRHDLVTLYSSVATSEIRCPDIDNRSLDDASVKRIVRVVKKAVENDVLPAMNKLMEIVRFQNDAPFLPPIRIFHLRIEVTGLLANNPIEPELRAWLRGGDGTRSPWYRRFPWSKYVDGVMSYQCPDDSLLKADSPVNAIAILLANAEQLFSLGQYSSAVVMAHTAVDATVSSFISVQFDQKGVSKGDIESFLISNGLPNKLDLVLKLLFNYNIKDDNKLWSSFSAMNSVRNDIVHRGKVAHDKDAEEMITIGRNIINLIDNFSAQTSEAS